MFHWVNLFVMQENPFDFNNHSHRRYNPLTNSWVLCSPHRAQRPWQGQKEEKGKDGPNYDEKCYLCPGNLRVGGTVHNPQYQSTFTFTNDFPAVKSDQPSFSSSSDPSYQSNNEIAKRLLKADGVKGECKVICFHPKHNLTIAEMKVEEIIPIIDSWIENYVYFKKMSTEVGYVQIFENKGEVMGCSNPHPHGQLWATEQIPEEPSKEIFGFQFYKDGNCSCLLCDYVRLEIREKQRVVYENDSFLVVVPWWAVWPFEVMILSKSHMSNLLDLSPSTKPHLADAMRNITCRYDNLFECSFPYSMGIHQAPVKDDSGLVHLHLHYYPPLLRSASVKKFQVGFEMFGTPQRDLTPEQAAARLSSLSSVHYKQHHI